MNEKTLHSPSKLLTGVNRKSYFFAFFVLIFVLSTLFIGWWSICLPATLLGFAFPSSKRVPLLTMAACALSWILIAFEQDSRTHWNISPRIGGLMGVQFGALKSGFLTETARVLASYFVIGMISALLSGLSFGLGRALRVHFELLRKPRRLINKKS